MVPSGRFRNPFGTGPPSPDRGALVPGLIDSHTHLCFGGDRLHEFRLRLQGVSYQEIAARGGGIRYTVARTREADFETLLKRTRWFLDRMLQMGVTTVEAKTGYGLDLETERKQLEVYTALRREHPVELHPTFLAHGVPDAYADRRGEYLRYLIEELMPALARTGEVEFVDVFCERGVFTPQEARRILQAGRALGWAIKVHADQFQDSGAARLAAELGAISADHLEHTPRMFSRPGRGRRGGHAASRMCFLPAPASGPGPRRAGLWPPDSHRHGFQSGFFADLQPAFCYGNRLSGAGVESGGRMGGGDARGGRGHRTGASDRAPGAGV